MGTRNRNPIEVGLGQDAGGYYVEWYQEGVDGDEGAGGESRVARWYGWCPAICAQRAKARAPRLHRYRYTGQADYTRNAHTCVGGEAE